MRNYYNIIFGLALLATVAACYVFKNSKYFSIKTGEEITNKEYALYKENDEFNYLLREESYLNYEAGFTSGTIILGLGLLVKGLSRRRKVD